MVAEKALAAGLSPGPSNKKKLDLKTVKRVGFCDSMTILGVCSLIQEVRVKNYGVITSCHAY